MKRFYRLIGCAVLLVVPGVAPTHELKVLASSAALESAPGRTTVYLSWGHRLPVDELVTADGVGRYEILTPGGKAVALKADGTSLQANSVELTEDGVHRAVATRPTAVMTFVIDEAGQRQLRRGPKTGITDAKIDKSFRGRQSAVALITVGERSAEPVPAVGLPAELVPLDPPAAWSADKPLRFRVLVEGEPAAGAEVSARWVGFKPDDAWTVTTKSDADGVVTVRPAQAGTWVLKARVEQPAAEAVRDRYDLESYTTTLSLEILP